MINAINSYNSCKARNPSFNAIQLARYGYLGNKSKDVIIYQLEESDIGYIKHLVENLKSFYKKYEVKNESAKQVIEEAFNASIEILSSKKLPFDKTRILMAFYDNEPSSILIGNALKVDKKGNFHYSSRKNHAKNETELDWLATWNDKIPGEGQATVYEYFFTLLRDGFKQCFVRSELPEKSSAVNFYTRMGFDKLTKRKRSIFRRNDNQYVIGSFDDVADKIIPMKATVMDMINTIKEKANTIMRVENETKYSCSLPYEKFDI